MTTYLINSSLYFILWSDQYSNFSSFLTFLSVLGLENKRELSQALLFSVPVNRENFHRCLLTIFISKTLYLTTLPAALGIALSAPSPHSPFIFIRYHFFPHSEKILDFFIFPKQNDFFSFLLKKSFYIFFCLDSFRFTATWLSLLEWLLPDYSVWTDG